MINFLKKTLVLGLIVGLLLPALAGAAVEDTGVQQALQQLTQERKVDQDLEQCKPQQGGVAGSAFTLANTIGRGIQQRLSQTISDVVSRNLNSMIQRQLAQNLPNLIRDGLGQRLPSALRSNYNGAINRGEPNNEDTFKKVLQQTLIQLLPLILQNGLPQLLQQGLSNDLSQQLGRSFQSQIPDILQKDPMLDPRTNMPGTFTFNDLTAQHVSGLTGLTPLAGVNTAQLTTNVQNGIATQAGLGLANSPAIKALVDRLLPLLLEIILHGIQGDPNHTGILGQISQPNFMSGIIGNYGQSGGFSGAGSGFDFNAWAGNNITAAVGFDLRPVSQAVAQPLALATVSGLGVSGYDHALGNLATIGYNGPITPGVLQGANQLTGLTPGGAAYLQAAGGISDPRLIDSPANAAMLVQGANAGDLGTVPGFGGTVPAADMETDLFSISQDGAPIANDNFGLGTAAAGGVDGNAIASNATAGLGSQIGASLQSGLVSGLSSGIAGLVDGIPYVGGLLSPIVEQITQQSLNQVLGSGGGAPPATSKAGLAMVQASSGSSIPSYDPGDIGLSTIGDAQVNATFFGFAASNLNTGKISAQTKTSNANEKTQIKQNADLQTTTEQQCREVKTSVRVLLEFEKMERVYGPAAAVGSVLDLRAARDEFHQAAQSLATSPLDPERSEGGQSVVADLNQNKSDNATAAFRLAANTAQTVNSEDGPAIARDISLLNEQNDPYRRTISQAQQDQLASNPQGMDSKTFWSTLGQSLWGNNNPKGFWLTVVNRAVSGAEEAKRQAELEYIAGQGYNAQKVCVKVGSAAAGPPVCLEWRTVVPGSDASARAKALDNADVAKTVAANGLRQDFTKPFLYENSQLLGGGSPDTIDRPEINPCQDLNSPCPHGAQQRNGYLVGLQSLQQGGLGNYNYLSFSSRFNDSLSQVLDNGLRNGGNRLFGLAEDQISGLNSNLYGGITRAGFTSANTSGWGQQKINDVILAAIIQAGITNFNTQNQIMAAISDKIIQLIRDEAQKQNQP